MSAPPPVPPLERGARRTAGGDLAKRAKSESIAEGTYVAGEGREGLASFSLSPQFRPIRQSVLLALPANAASLLLLLLLLGGDTSRTMGNTERSELFRPKTDSAATFSLFRRLLPTEGDFMLPSGPLFLPDEHCNRLKMPTNRGRYDALRPSFRPPEYCRGVPPLRPSAPQLLAGKERGGALSTLTGWPRPPPPSPPPTSSLRSPSSSPKIAPQHYHHIPHLLFVCRLQQQRCELCGGRKVEASRMGGSWGRYSR